jgi:hypothetical protein
MKTIHITYKGEDMGESYIYDQKGQWWLGDAFYDLADKIGCDSYDLFVVEIFKMLDAGQMQGEIGVLSFVTADCVEA